MSGEPLTSTTGMLRTEIDTKVDLEITKAKEAVRAEVRSELAVITKSIGAIEAQVTEQRHDIRNLRQGQINLSEVQEQMRSEMAVMRTEYASGNAAVLRRIEELSQTTTTITEETADGIKVTKHFRSWGTVASDIKKFWAQIAIVGWLLYHLIGGWCAAHGITWATIWLPSKH